MEIRRGKIYGFIFLIFIICLAIGGFFLTKTFVKDRNSEIADSNEPIREEKNLKINKSEDYIYFQNGDTKNLTHEIVYQDIFINIDSNDAQNIMDKLNMEMEELKNSFKILSEANLSEEEQAKVIYKEDNIYKADYRKYTRYFYKDYATILIDDYSFDAVKGKEYQKSFAYTFDTLTGKLIPRKTLLDLYNLNMTKIKERVAEKLNKSQTVIEEVEQINIVETLNNLDNDDNCAVFINKSGFLSLSYLVKSAEGDYNDVIIFN